MSGEINDDDFEPSCGRCGSSMLWSRCEDCENGYSHHDCGEDTCACRDKRQSEAGSIRNQKELGGAMSNDQRLWELARDYHDVTEAFDRIVCTGPMGKDGILPANPREVGIISRNAKMVFHRLVNDQKPPVDPKDLREAIRNYRRSTHD